MPDDTKPESESARLLGPSKLPAVGTTIFTVMSQLAQEHRAVNLGQGFPDFDCDPQLKALVSDAMQQGHNQYAPMAGLPLLREQIAQKVGRVYGRRYDSESEITVTAGATQAILTAVLAVVRTGDEVVILEPAYDSYGPAIALAGGQMVPVALDCDRHYRIDWDRVHAALTPRTRMLILNSPHNPTGAIIGAEDIGALEAIVRRHPLLILSDEVYEHIVFDGRPHLSLSCSQLLASRTFVVSSFGKTFHVTGWKVGTCCAPAPLMAEFRKVHQFNVFTVNTPVQWALARFLQDPHHYLDLPAFYQRKRDRFMQGLARTRFVPLPCQGTFFVLTDYSAISDETEEEFARRLVIEHGVAAIPLAPFYAKPVNRRIVRFCFAKQDSTLDAGLERLARV
ncbi:MAG TPA: pyridoxal phosphate-dependent aminotransferase [Burkholderiaceae bacterium]|nr:pyridoxal phosphate-dependent aminotransferase [Burkholderiaceae bacterium]